MDHKQRAREWLKIVEDVSPDHINNVADEAKIDALAAIGHALLAIEERLTAIAAGVNSPDSLGSQFGGELLERLEGIADELEMSRKETGDRIREELADIRATIDKATR